MAIKLIHFPLQNRAERKKCAVHIFSERAGLREDKSVGKNLISPVTFSISQSSYVQNTLLTKTILEQMKSKIHEFLNGKTKRMSKKLILITTMILATLTTFAGNRTNNDLRKFISNNVAYPSFLKKTNNPEKVTVSFTIKEDGTLQVISVNTENEQLKNHVTKELKDIKVKPAMINTEAVYTMDIVFIKK